jgi:hypothetical protein
LRDKTFEGYDKKTRNQKLSGTAGFEKKRPSQTWFFLLVEESKFTYPSFYRDYGIESLQSVNRLDLNLSLRV